MTDARGPFAPDLLRPDTGVRASSPRPSIARPGGAPGAALNATASRVPEALPPGRRVVALREAEGVSHILPVLPESLPPGEGMHLLSSCMERRARAVLGLGRRPRAFVDGRAG